MLVIANSSSLIALAKCNGIKFLDILFTKVKVPEAVYIEICNTEKNPETEILKGFLSDKVVKEDINKYLIRGVNLGRGELEAIALYKILNADFLLIDDKKARKIARLNNVKVIGSLGVILKAKEKEIIQQVKPYIESLLKSNIRISKELIKKVLQLAREE